MTCWLTRRIFFIFILGAVTSVSFGKSNALAKNSNSQKSAVSARYSNPELCTNQESDGAYIGERLFLCDAEHFGDAHRAQKLYSGITYDRNADRETERARYVTELYAFVKQVSQAYLLKREPKASPMRLAQFGEDIMEVAYHESNLTHYAIGRDKNFKLMASDVQLISRGLMQINQMFHSARDRENSLDIYNNLMLGIDLIYNAEIAIDQKSAKGELPCITKAERASREYPSLRLRGAWSHYNGGGDYCRFTSTSRFRQFDNDFLYQLQHPDWRHYVTDPSKRVSIDMVCLENGGDLCGLPEVKGPIDTGSPLAANQVAIFTDGTACYTPEDPLDKTTCVSDSSLISCLGVPKTATRAEFTSGQKLHTNPKVEFVKDRAQFCAQQISGLSPVGAFVALKQPVNIYDEVAGKVVGRMKQNQTVQILDFQISNHFTGERWYKVAMSSKDFGFFRGGNSSNWQNYTQVTAIPDAKTIQTIPVTGNEIEVVLRAGLKFTNEANSSDSSLDRIPFGTNLQVSGIEYRGSENQIFARVDYKGRPGYIYVGQSQLSQTVRQYIKIKANR